MKKNGFAPILIIILAFLILGTVGYFAYKSSQVNPKIPIVPSQTTAPIQTSMPVTAAVNGQEVTVDMGNGATIGTIKVLPNWKVVSDSRYSDISGQTIKSLSIQNGDYSIQITSSGTGAASCNIGVSGDGGTKENLIKNGYLYFMDKSGNEYLRQNTLISSASKPGVLEVCSNSIMADRFALNLAKFGSIDYKVPDKLDAAILNQMDSMVASFTNK